MTAQVVITIGLFFNIAGVVLLFFFGLPQPDHGETAGVAMGLAPANVLRDGRTVADHQLAAERRKRFYRNMAWLALSLLGVGFAFQLVGTWMV